MHIPYSTSGAIINVVRVINVHCDNTLTEGYIKTTISHNLLMNKAIFFFFFLHFSPAYGNLADSALTDGQINCLRRGYP